MNKFFRFAKIKDAGRITQYEIKKLFHNHEFPEIENFYVTFGFSK